MMATGAITTESQCLQLYPYLYFRNMRYIRDFLGRCNVIHHEPREIAVRINYGACGTGKTTDSIVN